MRYVVLFAVLCLVSCDKDPVSEDPLVTVGRDLFADPKFSGSGAVSCETCHPKGDMDNKHYHFPPVHDSTGGMPNLFATPTLFGVSETGPYLWKGEGGSDLREVTRVVIETIMGGAVTEAELDALVAYQMSLRVPANPWKLPDGRLTTAQERGMKVFDGAGQCNVCHSGAILTNRTTIQIWNSDPQFDVPSLRWIFATAPYFHDGRSETLRDVVDHYADSVTVDQMTSWGWNALGISEIHLSEQEKEDLVEYLRTL